MNAGDKSAWLQREIDATSAGKRSGLPTVELIGFDADGDKVWRNDVPGGLVTYNDTEQGAEWTFECGGGYTLLDYAARFGPITEEKEKRMDEHDPYLMLYCDQAACRVNTFEFGQPSEGDCPGCEMPGLPIPERVRG